ncbi:flagellar basal body-associated protein FliL [Clostridium tetanomorphum]|uniref:Flagellar protein FliL n=1 Tax=Clostridium tetanomorphum TaxID=1553 RepID=A0A923E920_CLOTT|nr:flagellar basal body-associated FliL family protein [Clostridium tetanomorphum]KAJ49921.1 flagellar basal body-associated protein FliL [Clostridium tetanomorphum DSM 665]MBC2396674.1 flagellar basal body protein FliL [Clostridium tetanomorphum]MBP1866141.1 flagellar basal body-associated protein FliL [Clostridium tetanomorphum]NRS85120.1 flagellar basal body-associated protein FliL [Clostridium tetanomorphum]NRZ98301.1 flagellar basal body-associated protein FliL [Clostridium tetanomorphum]
MSENNVENKKGGKLKLIIIILLIVVIIGGGAFAAYMLLFNNKKNQIPANSATSINNQQMNNANLNNNGFRPAVSDLTFDMGEFLVNLSDEEEKRFLKTKVVLGYENKKLTAELEKKKPILIDAINTVLRSKKSKDFTQKGTDNVKLEILNKINQMFENGRCDNVYFTELLVQ